MMAAFPHQQRPAAPLAGAIERGAVGVLTVAITGTSNLRDAVAFAVLFAILLIRPSGLLGRGKTREA